MRLIQVLLILVLVRLSEGSSTSTPVPSEEATPSLPFTIPHMELCFASELPMTPDNYRIVYAVYKKCQQLGTCIEPGKRREYYEMLADNLKRTMMNIGEEEIPPEEEPSLYNHFKQLFLDLKYLAGESFIENLPPFESSLLHPRLN